MKVPFLNLHAINLSLQDDLKKDFYTFLESGRYIGGAALEQFEVQFSQFCEALYCVGVGNGLDALTLSLKALGVGKGDEVIVPNLTFVATWLAVTQVGAQVKGIEPNEKTYNIDVHEIERAINKNTKAIIVVHLYGQPADLEAILEIGKKHNIPVIEDAAQAHGAVYKGKKIGSHGDIVAWSFYPGKNLGALGDAGAVTSNNKNLIDKVKALSNYGSKKRYIHKYLGVNSRLDPLQAYVLSTKLKHLDKWNLRRAEIANIYLKEINLPNISLPYRIENINHAWHLFCIRIPNRDLFRAKLLESDIETLIHYPIPPYSQEAYKYLGWDRDTFPLSTKISDELVSLPICPIMTDEQVEYVVKSINNLKD